MTRSAQSDGCRLTFIGADAIMNKVLLQMGRHRAAQLGR